MPRGGPREGAGRPTRSAELGITKLAVDAIIKYYGSLEDGFIALLNSQDTALIKFVWEHAAGKPRERVDIDIDAEVQQIQIIRLPENFRDNEEEEMNQIEEI
jgi:hypothetical protein